MRIDPNLMEYLGLEKGTPMKTQAEAGDHGRYISAWPAEGDSQ